MKKIAFALFPMLLFLLFVQPASAQVTDKGWYCAADKRSGECNGPAACDQAWAEHLRDFHSGGTSSGTLAPKVPKTPMRSVVEITAIFTTLGVATGSLGTRDGVNQWKNGAMGAGGFGAAVAAAVNANKMPAVVGAAIATAGGAAAGKQVGDFQVSQGTQATSGRDTAIGAAAGFATWGVGKLAIGPASQNLAPRWMGSKGKLNFILTGRWLGVIARW